MKYEIESVLLKTMTKPMNSYLQKVGKNITNLSADYKLDYSSYTNRNTFDNGFSYALNMIIGEYNEYPRIEFALLNQEQEVISINKTDINSFNPEDQFTTTFNIGNDIYIVNLIVSAKTEVKNERNENKGKQFDSTLNYSNEYANVHFYIEAPYYDYSTNYSYTKEQQDEFYKEVYNIFKQLGWEAEDHTKGCGYIVKGKQKLYLHPQDFSGEILKNEIQSIHDALQNCKTFDSRWTTIFETIYDMSDDEYINVLESKKGNIRHDIIQSLITKRSNLYYPSNVINNIVSKYILPRLNKNDKSYGGQTYNYITEVLNELINQGYIVTANTKSGTGYRTINKTEQKQLKLAIA